MEMLNATVTAGSKVLLIEDNKYIVEDIKEIIHRHDVIDIQPSNFWDVFYQVFLKLSSGILIDVNLQRFQFDEIFIGNTDISNGIDIAKYLFEYNSELPISVYSSYYKDNAGELRGLNANILIINKSGDDNESFKRELEPFFSKVEECKNLRLINVFPNLNKFSEYTDLQKENFLKNAVSKVKAKQYFKAIGHYAWYVHAGEVILDLHGPVIENEPLNDKQLELNQFYGLKSKPFLTDNDLKKLAFEKEQIPLIFWNFSKPDILETNLKKYAPEVLKLLSPEWIKNFSYQAAQAVAEFFYNREIQIQKTRTLLGLLSNFGRYEFCKILLRLGKQKIKSADQIIEYFTPFSDLLENKILDVFEGTINRIERENGTAWVELQNIFDSDVLTTEPFNLELLQEYGIFGEGAQFQYILYKNDIGRNSFDIEPLP